MIGNWLLLIVGIICLVYGCHEFWKLKKFQKKGIYAQGRVVSFKNVSRGEDWVKLPMIRFPIGETGSMEALGEEGPYGLDDRSPYDNL
jgi:hypothetical protein